MQFGRRGIRESSPVVFNLLIINGLVFLAQNAFEGPEGTGFFNEHLALFPLFSGFFKPYQLVTYMFMHANLMHIIFNMISLWMFGSMMEKIWGSKRFLVFYLICGVFAGIVQMVISSGLTVGASGAIMGVLVAYGYTFPNTQLFIMPIPFPIKAKWAIMGFIAYDLFGGFSASPGDNVAHFAHIGGALAGFLIVLYWNRKNRNNFF